MESGNKIVVRQAHPIVKIVTVIIDREAWVIIRLVASVCLFVGMYVCVFVRALLLEHIFHYQSKVFVCVSVISCCFDRLRHRGRSRF